MKKNKYATALIALLFFTGIYAQEQKSLSEKEYSISYDDTWSLTQNGELGLSFVLKAPLEDEQDRFQENINLMVQDISNHDLDLAAYTEISLDQIKNMISGSELLSSSVKSNGEVTYQEVIFIAPNGSYRLKFMQHYFLTDKKAYILTYTAEVKNYERYVKSAKEIMKSFRTKS